MTVLCGGGPSSPKAGVAETVIFTSSSLASLLNNRGGWWATLAAPLLGVLAYQATELCSTDPPAAPTISASEYQALLALSPWDELQSALGKLANLAKIAIWYELCQCSSGPLPTPVGLLTPPVDVYLPTYGSGPCKQPILRSTSRYNPTGVGQTIKAYTNITRQMFPELQYVVTPAAAGWESQEAAIFPDSWNTWQARHTLVTSYAETTSGVGFAATVFNPDRTIGSGGWNPAPNDAVPSKVAPVSPQTINRANTPYFALNQFHTVNVATPPITDMQIAIDCADLVGGSQSNCCSDPTVHALLGQLIKVVTLIQRQNAPFAYIPGTLYSGLTGQGQVLMEGAIGAQITITAYPSFVGLESGNPDVFFEAGWINWQTADGVTQREFLRASPQLSLPRVAGLFTHLNYFLPAGVSIDVQELCREA